MQCYYIVAPPLQIRYYVLSNLCNLQFIIMVCDIPGNGRIMLLCRGKAASATITCGASIMVPGRKAGGFHAHRWHGIVDFSKVVFVRCSTYCSGVESLCNTHNPWGTLGNHKPKGVPRSNCAVSRSRSCSCKSIYCPLVARSTRSTR